MAQTILSHPIVVETLLPFLLVFTLVFAVLQKTKILGDGKKQIDALVALCIGLIVVAFGYAAQIIVSIIPFLAVFAVILLVFMLLYGMTFTQGKEFKLHWGVQTTIGLLATIGLIIVTLLSTGAWDYIVNVLETGSDASLIIFNLVFVVVIIVAVAVVLKGSSGGSSSGGSGK